MNSLDYSHLLTMFKVFISSPSGISRNDYGDPRYATPTEDMAFYQDHVKIERQRKHARKLLTVFRDGVIDEEKGTADLMQAMERTWSGRLTIDEGKGKIEYLVGQYYCTEYLHCVCCVLATAISINWRCDYDSRIAKASELVGLTIAKLYF